MKSDCKKNNGNVSESRKIRKPLMEKKRRARINDSLETLKQMLLDSKTALKESSNNKSMQRTAKLEKADILEMTVTYLQHLRSKMDQNQLRVSRSTKAKEVIAVRPADSSCDGLKIGVTLVPTRLHNGGIAFVPAKMGSTVQQNISHNQLDTSHNVWRPW